MTRLGRLPLPERQAATSKSNGSGAEDAPGTITVLLDRILDLVARSGRTDIVHESAAAKLHSVTSTDALKRFRVLRLDSCGSNVQSGIGVAPVVRVVTHRTGLSFSPPLRRILILES
ncbi:MAG: hypothetical protein O3C60_11680 [Planctomycetota bacterium]|nr:hypothetical protein [Planctomycetota bacterium]